ncbi:MAG: hypothetical protein GY769_14030 [bacterium]|nr:hypothetical protein [bacterium]
MRKIVLYLISISVLALTYAALDDITTGREPSLVLEWLMVGAAAIWFSALAAGALRRGLSDR